MNRITRTLRATSIAALLVALMSSNSWADTWNKKTVITINSAMQIPGAVLQPGTYVFKLADSSSNRHIVQVFDKDETNVIATVLAIPNYRMKPTGDSEFGFWEAPANTPQPIRSWFYPGDNFGQEFAYPKTQAVAIAATTPEEVPTVTRRGTSPDRRARAGAGRTRYSGRRTAGSSVGPGRAATSTCGTGPD